MSTDFRERLAHLGLTELVTFTFISPDRILPQSQLNESLILSNPISKELSVMRNSLLPNLLDNAAKNFRNGAETMNTFEIGSVFFGQNYEEQKMFLSILKSGFTGKKNWLKKRRMFDFFDLKSDIYELFQRLKIHKKIKLKRSESIWYHPGKAADIIIDDIKVGSFGEIHPLLKNKFGIKLSSFISELELNKFIILSKGTANLSESRKYSILEGTIESIIGAVFLDSDWDTVSGFILNLFEAELIKIGINQEYRDSKTELQELLQSKKLKLPKYDTKESKNGFICKIELDSGFVYMIKI